MMPRQRWVWRGLLGVTLLVGVLSPGVAAHAQKRPYRELRFPPLRDLTLPKVERAELANGLVVYLVEDRALPRVEGHVIVRTGSRLEPADKVGLASIVGQVLRTGGTATRTGEEIDRALENVGASIETRIGTTMATASLFTLKQNLPQVLEILADLLRHPAFPEDKLELAKVQERTAIARRNDDVIGIANREFAKLLYGAASPYARTTEYATIARIARDDLIAFHRRYFHPNQTLLGLWGDFDVAEAKALIEQQFGAWPRQQVSLPPAPQPAAEWSASVNVIQKDDVNQTNLRIGHLGGRYDDEDYYALNVLAEIFGGGFSSRLFRRVRSELGLAYAVAAVWQAQFDYSGSFLIFCNTKSESTVRATQEILKELERMTREPVTAEELRVAKDAILNSFVFNFDTTGEIVRRLMTYEYYGYPRDFLEKFKVNVERVTADDVLRAARARLHPDKLVILAVGRQQDFDQPLATLGAVNTLDIAIPPPPRAEAAAAPAATPESLARGRQVLEAAISGMGGLAAIESLRDLSIETRLSQVTPQGEIPLVVRTSVLLPDKWRQDVRLPFGEVSLVFDGERGWQKSPQGVQELPAAQLDRLRQSLARGLERLLLDAHRGQRSVQFLESATIDGAVVDILLVTDPAGDAVRLYVEKETGRVLKKSFQGISPFAGPVQEEQIYSDFRPVGPLTVPFKVLVLHNGQKASEGQLERYQVNSGIDPKLFARD